MHIREIKPADMDAIFTVRVATWHNSNAKQEMTAFGITPSMVKGALETGSHRGWLCEIGEQVVGFAMGDRTNGEMWVIAVLKAYEGRGIGRLLLEKVEHWLWSEGWTQIWLTTDTDESLRAVGFYRHQDWRDWKFAHGDRYMRKSRPKEI